MILPENDEAVAGSPSCATLKEVSGGHGRNLSRGGWRSPEGNPAPGSAPGPGHSAVEQDGGLLALSPRPGGDCCPNPVTQGTAGPWPDARLLAHRPFLWLGRSQCDDGPALPAPREETKAALGGGCQVPAGNSLGGGREEPTLRETVRLIQYLHSPTRQVIHFSLKGEIHEVSIAMAGSCWERDS